MKTKILFAIILIFLTYHMKAQNMDKQVISNAGESVSNSSHKLTFTLGEPIVGKVSNSTTINQGFLAGASIQTMVSVENQIKDDKIKIYPNPVQNNLNIDLTDVSGDIKLILFDIAGKQLLSKELSKQHNGLDTSQLPSGMYLINIYNSNSNFMKSFKIVKK